MLKFMQGCIQHVTMGHSTDNYGIVYCCDDRVWCMRVSLTAGLLITGLDWTGLDWTGILKFVITLRGMQLKSNNFQV